MSDVFSNLFGKKPKQPQPPILTGKHLVIGEKESTYARDDLLRRLAKLRRATLTSELSNPNVRRKMLGAGV